MREVAVIGIGCTKFGKFTERSIADLGIDACWEAIKDANVQPKDIGIAYAGNFAQWRWGDGLTIGPPVLRELGITGIPITRVESGCATASSAFAEAYYRVASGFCDVALAFGVEQMTVANSSLILSIFLGRQWIEREGEFGHTGPAIFALMARRHMFQFGTTKEQLAMVAVKNRKYGSMNPLSQLRNPVTLEEVLNSRMICEPLTLPQCCPRGDGSAAVVLAAKKIAKRYSKIPVYVAASIQKSGTYRDDYDLVTFPVDVTASKAAYETAGIGPEDIDLAEVHDCFSPAEIIHYEDLGFCKRGEGGHFVESGQADIGGKIAVNTSGGLLSKGHLIGATGISQITEVVKQLRGQAGARQVEGAKVGLQHNAGGFTHTEVASCMVNIFKR